MVRLLIPTTPCSMVSINAMNVNRKANRGNIHRRYATALLVFLCIVFLVSTFGANKSWDNLLPNKVTDRRRLEFVHITKTGGSAIEKLGAEHDIMWGACHYMNITEVGCFNPDIAYIAPNYQSYALTSPWHTPPKIIRLVTSVNEPYTGADLFTVVRNPYSRIISEYYCPWTGFRKKGINNRDTMNNWIVNTVKTLEKTLAEYSSQNPRDRPKEQSRGHNEDPQLLAQKHFVNQAEYVFDNGVQVIEHIVHYENIREEFNNLMGIYGLKLKLPNKESHGVNTRGEESKLNHLDLLPETIAVINKYAVDDFKMLGYEMVDNFQDAGKYSFSVA